MTTTECTRCNVCKKKLGLFGFKCRACNRMHCISHNLPEEHKCTMIVAVIAEEKRFMESNIQSVDTSHHNYVQMQ
jgi:predicted nucleic acid binding AN1-type Zn finger protein